MKYLCSSFLWLAVLSYSVAIDAQNLVPNPSFEEYKKLDCFNIIEIETDFGTSPKRVFDSLLYDWVTPTNYSLYFLSTLVSPTCNRNSHYCNNQYCTANPIAALNTVPKDGHNMVGIALLNGHINSPLANVRSYVQTKLNTPLIANKNYLAGCYNTFTVHYTGGLLCNNLGLYFSSQPVSDTTRYGPNVLLYEPQVNQNKITEPNSWKRFSGCFKAVGGEQYVTIGNFKTNKETEAVFADPSIPYDRVSDDSYNLIDSVFTEEIPDPFIPNVITPNGDGKNDKLVMKNIHFGWWGLDIFNRWGQQVFHSDDYRNTWDGGDLSAGVYYYDLHHRCPGIYYKGALTIIR